MPLSSFTLASNSVLKDTLIFIQVLEGRFVSELTRDVAPWGSNTYISSQSLPNHHYSFLSSFNTKQLWLKTYSWDSFEYESETGQMPIKITR